jgi:hypothetical protein
VSALGSSRGFDRIPEMPDEITELRQQLSYAPGAFRIADLPIRDCRSFWLLLMI